MVMNNFPATPNHRDNCSLWTIFGGTSKRMSKSRQILYLSNEIKLFNWLYFHKKFSSRQQTFNTKVFYAIILLYTRTLMVIENIHVTITTLRSFVEFAAADFEYCSWSASMTKLYCSLIKVQLEYCHNCRFQSWCHLDHGRTTDQRRFHFPLLSSSHTLSSFAAVYSPLLPYFHIGMKYGCPLD